MLILKINMVDPESYISYGAPREVWIQYVYNIPTETENPSKILIATFFIICLLYLMLGYITIFLKRDNFCDFLFAFLGNEIFSECGLLLKERICKFFPSRVGPYREVR